MSDLFALFGIAAALAAVLANIGIWSPRRLWVKLSAVVAVALFLPASYGAFAELLSRPKPVDIEWAQRTVPEATVIASRMIEDKAIYLWLALDGLEEPRAYQLAWSKKLAKQLRQASQQAEAEGTAVKVRRPFDADMDEMERVFYPEPQPAPPAKQVSDDDTGPLVFKGTTSQ